MARRALLFCAAACALALPTASASAAECTGDDTTISILTLGSARDAVLCLVNAERSARGLDELSHDSVLERAAQRHSQDMLVRDFFAHVNPDGEDPGDRITQAGYEWGSYGENIAAGYRTPRLAMEGWMQSEGHCENVLNPGFTELGVGITALAATLAGGLGTWTQNFGRPLRTAAPGNDREPQQGCPYAELQGSGEAVPEPETPATPEPSAGETPAPSEVPDLGSDADPAAAAPLTLALRRFGRRLVIAGTATASRVRVTLVRHGRTVFRTTASVRQGRYRLRLRSVPLRGRIVVRVTGGGQRVTRSAR